MAAKQFAALVEIGIAEPDLVTRQEVGVSATAFPEHLHGSVGQIVGKDPVADQPVHGGQARGVSGVFEILNVRLCQHQGRVFVAPDPRHRDAVVVVNDP